MSPSKKQPPRQTSKKPPARKTAKSAKSAPVACRSMAQVQVVGIGASAGGLEALEVFFSAAPADSGMAFVVVTHLDPDHTSLLPELIGRKTVMPVQQVEDGIKVAANQVFVIPPNKEMALLNGHLQLLDMTRPRGVNLPIDTFLRSLAQDQSHRAIGVILSGTGTDGSLGIRAIKGEAGMIMVQDLDSAKYDGMPRSAIATGLVDYVLPPAQMPSQLLNYVQHQDRTRRTESLVGEEDLQKCLQKIFVLLRARMGHDFSQYKQNTICRRIERRMHVHQIDKIGDYVRYLGDSQSEVATLFKELLIGVTSFFRDPEAFEHLRKSYLPDLLKDKPEDYQVRIWVPGCSTGEEAYTVAMVLTECMAEMGRHFPVQIFGTDLDEDAINTARTGLYPTAIAADVSPKMLNRYFTREDDHYQIRKNIRDMVIFAQQNLTKDPPFTKLDLLCCRNLLIYFVPELQKKLLPIFHYSLKEDGLLFLGSSETIGSATDLFDRLDKKWKIFQRLPLNRSAQAIPEFPSARPPGASPDKKSPEPHKPPNGINTPKLLKAIIAQSDMPPCVVINDADEILYIHGRTGRFLEPAEGEISFNLLEMARPGLKAPLTNALQQMAAGSRQEKQIKGLQLNNNGAQVDFNLIVKPLPDLQLGQRGMRMIIFEEVYPATTPKSGKPRQPARQKKSDELRKLEDELQYTRDSLQTTIEEMETANEELKSTNEELQSTNEELQSTNEEMETSKEELQSLNEESTTVNSELQGRIDELVEANDDIKNLLDATEIATIFLDIDLNIRRFTSKVTELFPLAATDIGRPIQHFSSNLKDVDLLHYTEKVLKDLEKQAVEVRDNRGTIYRMIVRPYRTVNNVIAGVVITFEDITELQQLAERSKRLVAIVKDANDGITLLDCQGNILAWNRGAEKMYGYSETEALNMNIRDLVPPENQVEIKTLLALSQEKDNRGSFVTKRLAKDGNVVRVWLSVTRLSDDHNRPAFIATTERDLSQIDKDALLQLTGENL